MTVIAGQDHSDQVLRTGRRRDGARGLLPFALAAAAASLPFVLGGDPFVIGLGVQVCIWAILAMGYTVTFGLAGQFSVAHAALYGAGAYVSAVLTTTWGVSFWWTIAFSVVGGAVLGTLLGLPAWRLGGDYVALVTLGLGVIAQEIMLNWTPVTGGPDGIANIPSVTLGAHVFVDSDYYLLGLALAALAIGSVLLLRRSDLGRAWLAIREDELAARAMGIRVGRMKVLSFAVGGGIAAVAGSLYAVYNGFVSSVGFGLTQSVNVILIVLIGGLGRVWTTVLAAAVLTVVTAEFTTIGDVSVGLYGFLMLVVIILRAGRLPFRTLPIRLPTLLRRIARGAVVVTDPPALAVDGIAKHFGGVVAIREISMKLTAGKTLAIIGQNGSGKTTLINIITGIYPPTHGKVRLRDRDITGLDLSSIARLGVSRTFQNLRLFEALSALDNVLLGLTGRKNYRVLGALRPVSRQLAAARGARHRAHDIMARLGIDHLANIPVRDLSHGDRRRVEIARALVCDPSVVALDEPTAGLTVDEGDRLVAVLDDVRSQGKAILIIEHNLRIVGAAADEVLIMHAGAAIASGRLDDVLANETVRNTYMGTVA